MKYRSRYIENEAPPISINQSSVSNCDATLINHNPNHNMNFQVLKFSDEKGDL